MKNQAKLLFKRFVSFGGLAILGLGAAAVTSSPMLPNDPDFERAWGILNQGYPDARQMQGLAGLDAGVAKVWEQSQGSRDIIVALIDTGVDITHPDLKNNIWTNEAELNGKPGVDDDGDGLVDDIHGYDFCHKKGDVMPKDPKLEWHGTNMAGIIGAEGNNGIGATGVNWNVTIMPLKFMDGYSRECGSDDDAIRAIRFAVDHGARVINASWGGKQGNKNLLKAIQYAGEHGVLFVTTAGNNGWDNEVKPWYPGNYDADNMITVAAASEHGDLWESSNYGAKKVLLASPGTNIYAPIPGGEYNRYSSTSSAAAFTSGVAALLLSVHPEWDAKTLRSRILDNTLPLPALEGKVRTGGMLSAYGALMGERPSTEFLDVAHWPSRENALSSEHPYKGGTIHRVTIREPGAKMIALHFSKLSLDPGDRLLIKNSRGARVEYINGGKTGDYLSPAIMGDSAEIVIYGDTPNGGYGFDIDRVHAR